MAKNQDARKRKVSSRNGSSGRGNGADTAKLNGKTKHKTIDETPGWQKTLGALVVIAAVLAAAFFTGVIKIDRNIDTDEAQDPTQEAHSTVADIKESKYNKTTSKFTETEPNVNQASQETLTESELKDKQDKDEATEESAKDVKVEDKAAKVESKTNPKEQAASPQRSQESNANVPAEANVTKKTKDKLDIPEEAVHEGKEVKERDGPKEDKAKAQPQEGSSKDKKKTGKEGIERPPPPPPPQETVQPEEKRTVQDQDVPPQRSQESNAGVPAEANATKKKTNKLDIPDKKKTDKVEKSLEDGQKEEVLKKGREETVEPVPTQGAGNTEDGAKLSSGKAATVTETDSPKGKMVTPKRTQKNDEKLKEPKSKQPPVNDDEKDPGDSSKQKEPSEQKDKKVVKTQANPPPQEQVAEKAEGQAETKPKEPSEPKDEKVVRTQANPPPQEQVAGKPEDHAETKPKEPSEQKDKKVVQTQANPPPQKQVPEKSEGQAETKPKEPSEPKDKKVVKTQANPPPQEQVPEKAEGQAETKPKEPSEPKDKKVVKTQANPPPQEQVPEKAESQAETKPKEPSEPKDEKVVRTQVNPPPQEQVPEKAEGQAETKPKEPSEQKDKKVVKTQANPPPQEQVAGKPEGQAETKPKEPSEPKDQKVVKTQANPPPQEQVPEKAEGQAETKPKEPSEPKDKKVVRTQANPPPQEQVGGKPENHAETKPKEPSEEKDKKVVQTQANPPPQEQVAGKPEDHPETKPKEPSEEKDKKVVKTQANPPPQEQVPEKAEGQAETKPKEPSEPKDKKVVKTQANPPPQEQVAGKPEDPAETTPKEPSEPKDKKVVKTQANLPPQEQVAGKPEDHAETKQIKKSLPKPPMSKDGLSKKVVQDPKDTKPQPPSIDTTTDSPPKTKSKVDPELPPSSPPSSPQSSRSNNDDVAKATNDADDGSGGRDKAAADHVEDASKTKEHMSSKTKSKKAVNKKSALDTLLEEAEGLIQKNKKDQALYKYEDIIKRFPDSAKVFMAKAKLLDGLAEERRSNDLLDGAILSYRQAADAPNCPRDIHRAALARMADRLSFFGKSAKSIQVYQELVKEHPDDNESMKNLAVQYLIVGKNNRAKHYFEQMLESNPTDGFAQVHLGFILKAESNYLEAIPLLRAGIDSGDRETNEGKYFFHLGDSYLRIGQVEESYKVYDEAVSRGHFRSRYQRSLYNVDSLRGKEFWTPKGARYAEAAKKLESNWEMIRDEALALLSSDGLFQDEEEKLQDTGDWKQFTLYAKGNKNQANCQQAPRTCEIIDTIPESRGCRRGQVKFSVMHPGTHVWPHCGPTNCRLRGHLGLVIPQPVRLRVGNITRTWEEGKFLIFDDSFEHEVWQEADRLRVILIVDLWHPDLTESDRNKLTAI